jgi:crotonobetainyl-CoA:carnitine CoA-transferase CaiB-like acyl-CoA transferase
MLGFPIKFAQAEARPVQPAPALGADTRDVLLQLGFAQDDILGLQERGVI